MLTRTWTPKDESAARVAATHYGRIFRSRFDWEDLYQCAALAVIQHPPDHPYLGLIAKRAVLDHVRSVVGRADNKRISGLLDAQRSQLAHPAAPAAIDEERVLALVDEVTAWRKVVAYQRTLIHQNERSTRYAERCAAAASGVAAPLWAAKQPKGGAHHTPCEAFVAGLESLEDEMSRQRRCAGQDEQN